MSNNKRDVEPSLVGRTKWFKERAGSTYDEADVPNTIASLNSLDVAEKQRGVPYAGPVGAFTEWEVCGPFPDTEFSGIGRLTQLAIHPMDGATLLAGSAGGGAWITRNGGKTWESLMHLQTTLTVGAVGIAPSKPEIMYVASGEDGGDWNPSWPGTGIYRSETEGKYWDLMANSLTDFPSRRFSALLIHTNDPDIIYVAGNKGLHKSIDGGKSWIKNPGLNSLFDGRITDVVMAHDDPDRIYIGVMDSGVFRSNTGGIETSSSKAFEHLKDSNQLPWGWNAGWIKLAIGVKGKDGSNFLAAKLGPNGQHIYTSSNGGATWDQKASGIAEAPYVAWCSVIAVDPHDQDILYAGAAHELKRTTNGGTNAADWISVNNGIHPDQQDLLFDPRDPKKVYLANDGGLYFSDDRGSTWTMRSGQLAVTQCYDLDISQKQPDVIGCGGQDVGIFYKGISGKWVNIPWYDGTQIAIDPTDPNIFYFSTQTGVKFLVNGAGKSIGKSPDAGNTTQLLSKNNVSGVSPWVTILKLDPTDPIVDPLNNRIIFLCGSTNLFHSKDGGQNWTRVEDNLGNPFIASGEISALEFAPSGPKILYLATSDGAVYRASNGGSHKDDWKRVDTLANGSALFPNFRIQSIAVNPKNSAIVWVVFGGNGVTPSDRNWDIVHHPSGVSHVFLSEDSGVHWKDVSGRHVGTSLPDVPTSAIALHEDPYIAYVGTDVGVYLTVTKGETWDKFQDGMPRCPITELRLNAVHKHLYASTMGRGIFVRKVN